MGPFPPPLVLLNEILFGMTVLQAGGGAFHTTACNSCVEKHKEMLIREIQTRNEPQFPSKEEEERIIQGRAAAVRMSIRVHGQHLLHLRKLGSIQKQSWLSGKML